MYWLSFMRERCLLKPLICSVIASVACVLCFSTDFVQAATFHLIIKFCTLFAFCTDQWMDIRDRGRASVLPKANWFKISTQLWLRVKARGTLRNQNLFPRTFTGYTNNVLSCFKLKLESPNRIRSCHNDGKTFILICAWTEKAVYRKKKRLMVGPVSLRGKRQTSKHFPKRDAK